MKSLKFKHVFARNLLTALAELYTFGILHGNLATEKIIVESHSIKVKFIDFNLALKVGSSIPASENFDFVTKEMAAATIQNKMKTLGGI